MLLGCIEPCGTDTCDGFAPPIEPGSELRCVRGRGAFGSTAGSADVLPLASELKEAPDARTACMKPSASKPADGVDAAQDGDGDGTSAAAAVEGTEATGASGAATGRDRAPAAVLAVAGGAAPRVRDGVAAAGAAAAGGAARKCSAAQPPERTSASITSAAESVRSSGAGAGAGVG